MCLLHYERQMQVQSKTGNKPEKTSSKRCLGTGLPNILSRLLIVYLATVCVTVICLQH